jgi:hypothetical protein
MFIANSESIKNTILLDSKVGEYLVTHGIPLLSYSVVKYVFANTDLLLKALLKLPRKFKKILEKGGGFY